MKTTIIKRYDNIVDAHGAKAVLEEAGIRCFLSDENIVGLYPMFSSPFGGIKLHVLESDADRACELLHELEKRQA